MAGAASCGCCRGRKCEYVRGGLGTYEGRLVDYVERISRGRAGEIFMESKLARYGTL